MNLSEKAKTRISWILSVLLFFLFISVGFLKLIAHESEVKIFESFGYAIWFMYFIGTLEVLGSIGLLIKKTKFYASIGLIFIMLGAIYSNIKIGSSGFLFPLFILILLAIVAWLNKPEKFF